MEYRLMIAAVHPDAMERFVETFIHRVVPDRVRSGFSVLGAWVSDGDQRFMCVLAHEAPEGYEAAERAYRDALVGAGVDPDASSLLVGVETMAVRPLLDGTFAE